MPEGNGHITAQTDKIGPTSIIILMSRKPSNFANYCRKTACTNGKMVWGILLLFLNILLWCDLGKIENVEFSNL